MRKRNWRWKLVGIGVAGLMGPSTGFAQDDAALLRKELEAMRAEYKKRIAQLEERIVDLEKSSVSEPKRATGSGAKRGRQPAAVPAMRRGDSDGGRQPEGATAERFDRLERMREQLDDEFRSDTEIRDFAARGADFDEALSERVEDILEGYLDISGYFRAGYGRSDQETTQRAFGLPGVAKYRLGNEAENYGEINFAKTFFSPGTFVGDPSNLSPLDGPVAHANVRLSFYNPYDNYGSADDTSTQFPEVWGSVANVIPSAPEVKFWAGSRFYRRHDIHINDFYFWDMSGGGGGVEDIPFGPGKLALAWIGDGAESAIYTQVGQPDPENSAGFSKRNIDLRYYDWPFLGGTGEVGFVYSQTDSGLDAEGNRADDDDGFALHLVRTAQGFCGDESLHKTSLHLGNGPAKTFNSVFETFSTADGTFIRPDPNESWRFRATDQWVLRPLEQLSLGTALVYQYTDFGDDAPDQHWVSGGLRPIWHFNDSFSIAFEGGVDWLSEMSNGESGTLGKFTIAPQLSFGDEFFSRPVIRLFATLAAWDDGAEGLVGGVDYADEQFGASWGLQMEAWW